MEYKIFVNGDFFLPATSKIPVEDMGFLFGYGLFETMRSYGGIVYKLEEHIKRLILSANFLKIPLSFSVAEISELVLKTLQINKLKDAYIKLILSSGIYPGKLSRLPEKPNFIIIARPFSPYPDSWYEQGVKATIASIKRNPSSPIYSHKSLNFLENLLAKREAEEKGYQEAIFLNTEGYLSEGSISNLFVVKKERIITPSLSCGCLPGITRKVVLNLCTRLGIPSQERKVKLEELFGADEAFLTNSLREILPLTRVDSHIIGRGKIGRITRILIEEYKKDIYRDVANFPKSPSNAKH